MAGEPTHALVRSLQPPRPLRCTSAPSLLTLLMTRACRVIHFLPMDSLLTYEFKKCVLHLFLTFSDFRSSQEIVGTVEVSDIDLPYVMHMLSSEEIEGLPPGGGLSAKRALIETKLNTLLPSLKDSEAGEDREYLL